MWKLGREVGRKLSLLEIKMENKAWLRKLQCIEHVITDQVVWGFLYFNDVHFSLLLALIFFSPCKQFNVFFWFFFSSSGKGDPDQGVKRAGSKMSSDGVWRCTRPVPWPHGAVQDRREIARHKLFVYGRLCRQRVLLSRNCHFTSST